MAVLYCFIQNTCFTYFMNFLGRENEIEILSGWKQLQDNACLSVIYGRRRIGKTRLIEETFKGCNFIKFEGIEGKAESFQQRHFLNTLSEVYNKNEYRLIDAPGWIDCLKLLSQCMGKRETVVLFDEFQWMAAGRNNLVSELKYVWDNFFTKNNNIHLVICGSICSFIVKKVLRSKALYGRIDIEINLKPLAINEISKVFSPARSSKEILELYMSVGGVPKYLEMINPTSSIRNNLFKLCFTPTGYLFNEYDRIFSSHFGKNKHYRKIISELACNHFMDRSALMKRCGLTSSGRLSEYLENLELADFIEKYVPVDKPNASRFVRFRISDPYLLFYFRFIKPAIKQINNTAKQGSFSDFVPTKTYEIWRGLAFEFFCRTHHFVIADKLGFSAVQYHSGSWWGKTKELAKFQIDLIFIRKDEVITLCEIKNKNKPIGKSTIQDMERKIEKLNNPKQYTIEKVLISTTPPSKDLEQEKYFNRILHLDDLLNL